ncbi:MAG: chromosome partitioning protein ParB [Betaproteobacteria bacterium RIFCSPLOWO2_02_FULL_67_26]|nr:MAG: chromosome partitioning protein ParB [Betaproteobacteria bacterium RIFCSPLOWO2_02_FULL_67_26]
MAKVKGLGRGLDALLGSAEDQPAAGETLATLPIEALQPGRYQPRTRMDQAALAELAESIKAQGVMQPILARPVGAGRYEIVAGERRWRAARLAGLASVPALVREVPDRNALAIALIENLQREDLNPLEEATGVKRLIEEFGLTHAQAAEGLGRSRAAITNALRLLDLAPPVQELMRDGKLDMGHARALLALPALRQIEIARTAVAKQLSVRQVEALVAHLSRRVAAGGRVKVDRDVARLEEEWSQRLGTTVRIQSATRPGSGRLVIHYASLDQLEALLRKLG